MRQPGRTAEGIARLVNLLAPNTRTDVTPHDLRTVAIRQPAGLLDEQPLRLDGHTVLGDEATDAASQLLISLVTDDATETEGWLPDGALLTDLLVLLRVYLGWRYRARIMLTLPTHLLPVPVLGESPVRLGLTCVNGLQQGDRDLPDDFTVELGHYRGLTSAIINKDIQRVHYRF
jgi:type VI secretion system protein ImpH